ncbi:LysR substrate-binding domain-containing protein [Pollutimonas bauzanensis]|nr:LysR substrate-binding domain-containing protein [Pollutimonas bauzanensis]
MKLFRPSFSLITLQVFVAVARLGSFTRAAESVHLTQSAVSKQVALLEAHLGVSLFIRAGGVSLTGAGREFLEAVEPALDRIARAAERIGRAEAEQAVVSLLAPPAVLQYWLISLLPQFVREHSGIDLRLTPRLLNASSPRLDLDAEIRFGSGGWQGARARYLFGREMCVVASPKLLARRPLHAPDDLAGQLLMSHVLYPTAWSEWRNAMGASIELDANRQQYDHYSLMIEALQAELGIGLVPRLLVRKFLASGELVAPFDEVMVGSSGYYLVLRDAATNPVALRTVGDWIKAQADEMAAEWLRGARRTVRYSENRK